MPGLATYSPGLWLIFPTGEVHGHLVERREQGLLQVRECTGCRELPLGIPWGPGHWKECL